MTEVVVVPNIAHRDLLVRGAAIERRVKNMGVGICMHLDKTDGRLDQVEQRLERIENKLDILLLFQDSENKPLVATTPAVTNIHSSGCCAVQ